MRGESRAPGADLPGQRLSLVELSQAIDSLRERLKQLEGAGTEAEPPVAEAPGPGADAQALGIVQEILSIPAAGLHPSEMFALAMDRASRLLAADRAMLFVAEPSGARLLPRSAHGFRREDLESVSIRPGEGIVGRVFKERRVLAHTVGDVEAADPFLERFPVREALAVPVRGEDDVAGVLYVGRRRLGAPFTTSDVLLLLVIADRVGGGLVHQALLDRRTRHIARLAALRAFGRGLQIGRPLDELLADACECGRGLVDVRAAAIGVGTAAATVELRAARGLPSAAETWRWIDAREGLTAELCAGDGVVTCRDVQSRPAADRSFLGDGGFHACLLAPLRSGSVTAGVLYLADTEVRDFSAEEIAAAEVLAAMVASALDNNRAREELERALASSISGQERIARVERAQVLGKMAAGLAHELNNIFAIILGKSRLLLARAHDEPLRDGLALLEEAAWRGADVVHRLTALSAPAAAEVVDAVDVAALFEEVIAQTRPRWKDEAEARGARIEVSSTVEDAIAVRGNPASLREALANLVLNAVDAMPNGGRIGLSARAAGGGVEVLVEDTGEGIAEEARARAFDPFFTTRVPDRMGLGLTVSQGVVTRHGGRIEISSAPGGGTRVTVWLPGAATAPALPAGSAPAGAPGPTGGRRQEERDAAGAKAPPVATVAAPSAPVTEDHPPTAPEPAPQPAGQAGPSGRPAASILVLEDEDPVRTLLVEALSQAGHTVETAVDGSSGLAKLEAGHFDVVLTDLALPQRSGLAVARAVKRRSPLTPVVLITGWGHLLDPERLREHGVDLMLVKPFRIDRVVSVVGDALRLRSRS